MMFGGYETIEAYEDDLYREESSSELSVDSEVEFQLYSQVHYAQDLGNIIREEECEEKNPGNSESSTSKPNQKNLIVLSDSEVIQLSDGSEVITLSDEDSIYKYKGKNIGVQAQDKVQGPSASVRSNELADEECKRDIEKTKPKERSGIIREVMIIEVSSSEEEESSISESDNVESWMLLGSEEDDKDDDILLNLVGCGDSVTEGEDGVNWFISEKDIEAQIANNRSPRRLAQRYYSDYKNVICRNCDKRGHLSKNCPLPQACPEIWRQYHLTECTEKNEYEEYVVSPFISYYDDKDEIQEREKRLKREIKVLKKNGHIPMSLKVPFMETADKNTYHNWRKRYLLWKNIMWPQEDKKMKNRNRDHEKHRRGERHHDVDDDFPRGPKTHSPSGRIKTQKAHKSFHHSSSNHKSRDDKLSKAGKQGKRKKKEKYLGNDSNDNLFLIKQRKKKF
ncbi:zinc finger CCHC domain-containing protein 7 isoform X4 [Nycticebus coucang]|uniref:zinc finger CCHC domain-containing protein 7 isoform X4 n=1 Tax=Nycticebus coucang TaxID=9470 RepID=UPI00234C3504|nr:zinc finger CCHC domain-containing protein 7 isoform X4 [Nycticebus coucang]